ncbi:nucleoside hydrolase [Cyclobacterium xiamenense]|uniref:nucleoside hydrolase n=1 Tax=Cyclobacterium xiamenense TaxID=1297121 RepID=UPI0035CFE099
MIRKKTVILVKLCFSISLFFMFTLSSSCQQSDESKIRVLLDTDANNELDDQHAMAYLFFNGDVFDVVGVTVNATQSGGAIDAQYQEAKRVMQLCKVYGKIPLLKGANASFEAILPRISASDFDGAEAVDFIIDQAHKAGKEKLVLLPVGKLTNIALALEKDPSIAKKVRIVWLGSNYPEPGEYNQDNDRASLNYVLNMDVPFEMVTVRYGKPSGTAAVTANRAEIKANMPGKGPKADSPVEGRHGGTFVYFGDYSVNLYEHIHTSDAAGTRALFDMAAVAILKNPAWAEKKTVPAPVLVDGKWRERPGNDRKIIVWENFRKDEIMQDFYYRMENYVLPAPY